MHDPELDEAVIAWVKREYKLMIGSQTAEEVKLGVAMAALGGPFFLWMLVAMRGRLA